jgi:hypothetical protein
MRTIVLKIRISTPVAESDKCKVLNRLDKHSDFSDCMRERVIYSDAVAIC